MTMGPAHATGSPSGRPDTSKKAGWRALALARDHTLTVAEKHGGTVAGALRL